MYKPFYLLLAALSLVLFLSCGDDDTPVTVDDLLGNWVATDQPHPGTTVTRFNADGTWTDYSNYAMTMVSGTGGWALDGSTLTQSNTFLSLEMTISKVDENHLRWSFFGFDNHLYRVGSVPLGQGTNTATQRTTGVTYVSNFLPSGQTKWFYFNADALASYSVYIDDKDNSGSGYSGDVKITVVGEDMVTLYGTQRDNNLDSNPVAVPNTPAGRVYIIVEEGNWGEESGNAFGLKISTTG